MSSNPQQHPISATPARRFLRGTLDSLPFVLVVSPFGLIFGVVGTDAGLNLLEVMSFSILVIAGAAQLTALQLLSENAPTIIVLLSAMAVNLRMAMYSAALVPHFGGLTLRQRALAAYVLFDQPYALASIEFEAHPNQTQIQKLAYYLGAGIPMAFLWYGTTLAGVLLGEAIPAELGVDFAVPLTFIAVVAPMLKSLAHIAAAMTSVALVLALSFMPSGTGLLIAASAALAVGALVETWIEKRRERTPSNTDTTDGDA